MTSAQLLLHGGRVETRIEHRRQVIHVVHVDHDSCRLLVETVRGDQVKFVLKGSSCRVSKRLRQLMIKIKRNKRAKETKIKKKLN